MHKERACGARKVATAREIVTTDLYPLECAHGCNFGVGHLQLWGLINGMLSESPQEQALAVRLM